MTEASLPRGEYVARVVSAGARSTHENIDTPMIMIGLAVCEGSHAGRTFTLEADLGRPGGLSQAWGVAQAAGPRS